MTLCRNRPILRHLDKVLSVLSSTRWQLVRLGMALVFTYLNIPQNVLVAPSPNYALPPCVECILQMTLLLPWKPATNLLIAPILLRRLVLTETVVL